jgi:hypothetical protein
MIEQGYKKMDYCYKNLEKLLEEACYRLPTNIIGNLINQAENIIINQNNSFAFEEKLTHMIKDYRSMRSAHKLNKEQDNNPKSSTEAA